MRERDLLHSVAERLRREGLSDLQVRPGNQRGADLEGILPHSHRRLFIEVKGVRKGGNERAAMGETLLHSASLRLRRGLCHRRALHDCLCGVAALHPARHERIWHSWAYDLLGRGNMVRSP